MHHQPSLLQPWSCLPSRRRAGKTRDSHIHTVGHGVASSPGKLGRSLLILPPRVRGNRVECTASLHDAHRPLCGRVTRVTSVTCVGVPKKLPRQLLPGLSPLHPLPFLLARGGMWRRAPRPGDQAPLQARQQDGWLDPGSGDAVPGLDGWDWRLACEKAIPYVLVPSSVMVCPCHSSHTDTLNDYQPGGSWCRPLAGPFI